MIPWRALLVFLGISVGATTAIAASSASMGWTVRSPAWGVPVLIAMWAPTLRRGTSPRRGLRRGGRGSLPLYAMARAVVKALASSALVRQTD